MFKSVSKCTPNSRAVLSFVATKSEIFTLNSADFAITAILYVNGSQIISQPVQLEVDDFVELEVNTHSSFGGHKFYSYSLGGIEHSVAIVNTDNYTPTVKDNDAPRRWFNYFPDSVRISFYHTLYEMVDGPLGVTINLVDIDRAHVVLDHLTNKVNFYYFNRELVTSVRMPSGPIEYTKSTYLDENSETRTELFVICNDKRLYRIRFNNRFSSSNEFFPTVTFIRSLELLWYEADLPTGESFLDARRADLRQRLNPSMTALDNFGSTIWAAGYDTVYVLNKDLQVTQTVLINTETIVAIACLDASNAYAVTRQGKIYHVTPAGTFSYTLIYDAGRPLGNPSRFTPPGENACILVPDPNNRRLLKITGPTAPVISESWNLGDFAPAYARQFGNDLWVTGYDTNRVLQLKSKTEIEEYSFQDKVTIVSVEYRDSDGMDPSILGVHYLRKYKTLNVTGIRRTVPIKLTKYRGPMSHIGSDPVKLILLGAESMPIYAGPGLACWVNGNANQNANTGDYFSVSHKAKSEGLHRFAFVLGNIGYDFDVEVKSTIDKGSSYVQNATAINRLNYSNATYISTPTVGSVDNGTTSINLGFSLNYYGSTYQSINVSTNGYITFGTNKPTQPTTVGNLNIDAIYVETMSNADTLIQNTPRTNMNPVPGVVTRRLLASGKQPGVYYETGSVKDTKFLKVAWVGSGIDPYPDGNNVSVLTSVTNSTRLPIDQLDFIKINNGDYIAGGTISQSTRVLSKQLTESRYFNVYKILGSAICVTSYTDVVTGIIQYSQVIGTDSFVSSTSTSTISSTVNGRNTNWVLETSPSVVTINGYVDPSVTLNYAAKFRVLDPIEYLYRTDISSYDYYEDIVEVQSNVAGFTQSNEFIVSNVSASLFYIGQEVIASNIAKYPTLLYGWPTVVSKRLTSDGTKIKLTEENTFQPLDQVTLRKTNINFVVPDAVFAYRIDLHSEVTYELNTISLTSISSIIPGNSIEIQGSFVNTSLPVTVAAASTPYNFKTESTAREYTYEVNFFSSRRFQYIEIFYNNSLHLLSNKTYLLSGPIARGTYLDSNIGASAGTSVVFSSDKGTGSWTVDGKGSFNYSSTLPVLAPKLVQVYSGLTNESNIEFLVTQDLTTQSNIILSTSYGQITVNGGFYTGYRNIVKNDIVRLRVPVNTSLRANAPILSIGDTQFPVPTIADVIKTSLIKHRFQTNSYPIDSSFTYSFAIPAADNYYIPDFYRSVTDPDYTYVLTRNGVTSNLNPGQTYTLGSTDNLTVNGIISSMAIYDTREIALVGERNVITVAVRTDNPGLVSFMNYGTIEKPDLNHVTVETFTSNVGNIFVVTDNDYYQSNTITLSTTSNISSANLYLFDQGTSFIINGVPTKTMSGNSVLIGSNVALARNFIGYDDDNATIYQVYYDANAVSNVYIPVGVWNVNNKVISSLSASVEKQNLEFSKLFTPLEYSSVFPTSFGSAITPLDAGGITSLDFKHTTNFVTSQSFATMSLEKQMSFAASFFNSDIDSSFKSSDAFITSSISKLKDKFGTTIFFKMSSLKNLIPSFYSSKVEIDPNEPKPTFLIAGKIDSAEDPFGTYIPIKSISSQVYKSSKLYTSSITNARLPTSYLINSRIVSKAYDAFTLFNSDAVTGLLGLSPTSVQSGLNSKWMFPFTSYNGSFRYANVPQGYYSNGKFIWLATPKTTDYKYIFNTSLPKRFLIANVPMTGSKSKFLNEFYFDRLADRLIPQYEYSSLILRFLEQTQSELPWANSRKKEDPILLIKTGLEKKLSDLQNELRSSTGSKKIDGVLEIFARTKKQLRIIGAEFFGSLYSSRETKATEIARSLSYLMGVRPEQGAVPAFKTVLFKPVDKYVVVSMGPQINNEYNLLGIPSYDFVQITPIEAVSDIKLEPKFDSDVVRLFGLLPLYKPALILPIPFIPMEDKIPLRLLDLLPYVDQIPLRILALPAMLDIIPESVLPLETVLFQHEEWEMNEIPDYGTYASFIDTWVDQSKTTSWWNVDKLPLGNIMGWGLNYDPTKNYSKQYNYKPGGFLNDGDAEDEKVKYYNAGIIPIPGTNYWNYRIYFKDRYFCVPKKGILFPSLWNIRGG